MVRVPLAFRGVAVLLLAASTVAGQTPEPPAELPLEPLHPRSTDFLRQYSAESHHPLLSLLVEGELTALDAATLPSKEPSRLTPTPQSSSAKPPLTEVESGPIEIDCPQAPTCLPFACPPPPPPPPQCHCRKCQRMHKHDHCGNYGPGYGNPYLGWPCAMGGCPGSYGGCPYPYPYQGGCSHRSRHKHGCGYDGPAYPGCGYPYGWGYGGGYGSGYGGGYGMMGYDGFGDGGCCGCAPFMAPAPPPPPPPCWCHKCQRKYGSGHHGCGYPGYGSPYGGGWGGGWGGSGYGGFMDGGYGCCAPYSPPPPPPPCPCRKCQRKHGCSYGYGYAGCGYPGWPAYPVPGANMWDNGYNSFTDPNCYGGGCGSCGCSCKRGHCWSRCHHGHCGQVPPYPYYAYPQMMPCMTAAEPFCADCAFGGDFSSAPASSGSSK